MGPFGLWEWLIILLVVILVFGTKKLKNMGGDVGLSPVRSANLILICQHIMVGTIRRLPKKSLASNINKEEAVIKKRLKNKKINGTMRESNF